MAKKEKIGREDDSEFYTLSRKLSVDERKSMLDKVGTGIRSGSVENADVAKKVEISDSAEAEKTEIAARLQKVSIFVKIAVWISSLISSVPAEEVYNRQIVAAAARELESKYPMLISFKRKTLSNLFYEKLAQLKRVSDFFRPYLQDFDKDPGAFYVLLGHVVMPEIEARIESGSDPYKYSMTKELSVEVQKSLVDNLNKTLLSIPFESQQDMYKYARCINWLSQLVKAPIDSLLSLFSVSQEGVRECSFVEARADFDKLARIVCSKTPMDRCILDVFQLYATAKTGWKGFSELDDSTDTENKIKSIADQHFSSIDMFTSTVPLEKLSVVVYGSSTHSVGMVGGGEDWFERYSEKWKNNLNRRIDKWNCDYSKQKLRQRILLHFKLSEFPMFPFRPWTSVPCNITFHNELTLGFMHAFMAKCYEPYIRLLKIVILEGDFATKDNRYELSVSMDNLSKVKDDLELLMNQLSAAGEYGIEFAKHQSEESLSEYAENRVKALIKTVENVASGIEKRFCSVCFVLVNLITGFLSEKYVGKYCALSNLYNIRKDECDFPALLTNCNVTLTHAYDVLKEMEPLEQFDDD